MDRKLKILLILIEPPLPFGNAGSRWFHVLYHQLKANGHEVRCLVASGVEKDIAKAKEVFADVDPPMAVFPFDRKTGLLQKLKSYLYPHRSKFSSDFLNTFQSLEPDSFDVIHVEQTWAGWVTRQWSHKTLLNVHFLQAIDLQYVKPKSLKERLLYKRYFKTEKQLISEFPFVRTCTPRLEKTIKGFGLPKKILETVPFGIDLSLYPFIPAAKRQSREPIVTLIGNMGWYPSASSAERLLKHLWPRIRQEVPSARCRIVGWKARAALKDYLHMEGVEILENVPDIAPYFEEASVLVYPPVRGSGMKIKVQEAMAFGVPVVTTSEGSEGLPVVDREHMGLSETDEGLIERAVEILQSPDLQERLRTNARALLESFCDPKATVGAIEDLYQKILETQG